MDVYQPTRTRRDGTLSFSDAVAVLLSVSELRSRLLQHQEATPEDVRVLFGLAIENGWPKIWALDLVAHWEIAHDVLVMAADHATRVWIAAACAPNVLVPPCQADFEELLSRSGRSTPRSGRVGPEFN